MMWAKLGRHTFFHSFHGTYKDMMGLIGAGNNPMVGMTVACAVAVEEAMKA